MRSSLSLITVGTLVLASCGGGGGGTQAQTEQAAIDAAVKAARGTFVNRSGDVINFMNEECRASVDTSEVKQALALAQVFLQSDDYNLSDIEVRGTATEFSPDAATIEIELIPPDGADLGFLTLSNEEVDAVYENGKWVSTECDFGDTTESDLEDLESELDQLGIAATQDDPAPSNTALPIGEGFRISVTDYVADAAALIEQEGGTAPFIDEGDQIALLAFDIQYSGGDEPANMNAASLQLVGADGVAIDQDSCGNMNDQFYFSSREMFSGGATSVVSCFSAEPSSFPAEPLVSFEVGFSGRAVFVAPANTPDTPSTVSGSTGPSPDGDLTDDRTAPNASGTAVDIGDGWTMTVNNANLDATAEVIAASDFNDPPPAGQQYALVNVTLAFDGEESPGSLFSVDANLVGDSNISADSQCGASSIPDELDTFAEIFAGGSATGNLCFLIDEADAASLVVYATGESFSDDYEFFSLN